MGLLFALIFIGIIGLICLIPTWLVYAESKCSNILYKLSISICMILIVGSSFLLISAGCSDPYKIEEGIVEYTPYYAKMVCHGKHVEYDNVFGESVHICNIQIDTINYIDARIEYRKPPDIFKHMMVGKGLRNYDNVVIHLTDEEYRRLYIYR